MTMPEAVDGKAIAREITAELKAEVARRGEPPTLAVFVLTDDLATETFISLKLRCAREVGAVMALVRLPKTTTTAELVERIVKAGESHDGVILQFPLPPHIDKDAARNAIPPDRDIDVISDEAYRRFEEGTFPLLPPVVGALREILTRHGYALAGRTAVVVGEGRLVGKPAAAWLRRMGARVRAVGGNTKDVGAVTRTAELLVLGAGSPGLIVPAMVTPGAVILDAGTSEAAGKLRGDMDPKTAEWTSLYTPVPGGVGPITVAMIFKNLLDLQAARLR